jgi:hypothetical protein
VSNEEAVRPELLALLRSHGLTAAVAARVARAGVILHRRSVQEGVEIGTTLDLATGRPVGPTLAGEHDSVNFTSQFATFRPGHRYLQLHTHPGNSSFSDHDLGMLLAHTTLRTLVVVAEDRHWYLLSKRGGQALAAAGHAQARWLRVFFEIARLDEPRIARGELTRQEALVNEVHETMARLAPELGLRYDDLEFYP